MLTSESCNDLPFNVNSAISMKSCKSEGTRNDCKQLTHIYQEKHDLLAICHMHDEQFCMLLQLYHVSPMLSM